MKLIKLNKLQELKLGSLNYKKQMIGELTVGLVNEARKQLMSISAANQSIKMDTEDYEEETTIIEKANEKIANVFDAIGFETAEVKTVEEVIETIQILLAIKKKETLANVNISVESSSTIIKRNIDSIIFFTVETALQLMENGEKEIYVQISGIDEIVVKFNNNLKPSKEFTRKIVMLMVDNNGVRYKLVNDNNPELDQIIDKNIFKLL